MTLASRSLGLLTKLENIVLVCVLGGMFVLVNWTVFSRYFGTATNLYSEELARILLIAMTYLGVAVATRDAAHIQIDVLFERLPPSLQQACSILGSLLVLIFSAVAAWLGIGLVQQTAQLDLAFTHSTLPFPVWMAQAVVPLCFLLTGLHAAIALFDRGFDKCSAK